MASSQRDSEREKGIVRSMQERRVDGVIIDSGSFSDHQQRKMYDYGIPIVIINSQASEEYRYSVYHDDIDGSRQVTRHLIDLGHQRIAYLGNSLSGRTTIDRLTGFREEMELSGLTIPEDNILEVPGGDPEDGYSALDHFLKLPSRPTALFCYNDMMALGVMRDGGFAEYRLVPEKQCYVLPGELDDQLGSQVETLATVVNGMNTLQMLPYDYVMILGFGPIGYLFAQFAKNIAAKVAVTEIDPFPISIAEECGLTVWNPNEVDVVEKITEFTYGRKADIVVEATGNAIEQALNCVTPGGKVLPFRMDSSYTAKVVPNEVTRWATKILGLYLGQNTMVPSIRVFRENSLKMNPFFTKTMPLADGIKAFDELGLDLDTLTYNTKSAMRITLKI